MSKQKPKGIGDVKITQKDVDDFFNSIHTDALVDSIKMSYKPTFKVKVKKTRKFHSAEAWIVKDCQGNYVTSVEFLRGTPKNVKTAYYNKPAFDILKFGQICVFNNYLEARAVANECGGKVYELGLIKVR